MSYVILDLEWTGSYSKTANKFVNEIIEFGAVKTDNEFNIIDTFSTLIKPEIGKKLCSKVSKLTQITIEELEANGTTFLKAVGEFSEFFGDSILLTWSTSDIHALIENYSYYTGDFHLPFLRSYCDIQEYCQNCLELGGGDQIGLSNCAEKLGIEFSEENHHRAPADAYLTFKCVKELISKYSLTEFIKDAQQDEFYERMMFKTYFLTDMESPDIDKSKMYFICEQCGCKVNQASKWRVYGNSFVSDFECPKCKQKFTGRISFKKKYDEVVVHKKLNKKKSKQRADKIERKIKSEAKSV